MSSTEDVTLHDPAYREAADIIGLYLNPPQHAALHLRCGAFRSLWGTRRIAETKGRPRRLSGSGLPPVGLQQSLFDVCQKGLWTALRNVQIRRASSGLHGLGQNRMVLLHSSRASLSTLRV
jgi:hypothetical protein